jgi:hypothetical protein
LVKLRTQKWFWFAAAERLVEKLEKEIEHRHCPLPETLFASKLPRLETDAGVFSSVTGWT